MRFELTIAVAMLGAAAALAQNAPVIGTLSTQNSAPIAEQTRLNTLINNLNSLHATYNSLKVAYDRYDRCASLGMVYAPNGTSLPGYNSTTKCAPLPNPPLVREVAFTTATTTGDMSAYGADAAARMQSFMNANGCPTSSWRVCTDHDMRYAFAKNFPILQTTSFTHAWYMGMDVYSANFSAGFPAFIFTNTYCNYWSGTTERGHAIQLYSASTTGRGLTLASCASSFPVACCR